MENKWEEIICEENGYQLIIERTEFTGEEKDIIEAEIVEDDKENEKISVDSPKLIEILRKFIREYIKEKRENEKIDLHNWLLKRLKEEFPEKSMEVLEKDVKELIAGVEIGKKKYEIVKEKRELGITPSDTLAKEIRETTVGDSALEVKEELRVSINILEKENVSNMYKMASGVEIAPKIMAFNKMTRYFDNINEVIAKGNEKMVNSLMTKAGNINQNPQLDGFIFEQFHENTFNIDAATKDVTNVRAEALVPKEGTGYGKNSVDLVVKVKKGNIEKVVRRYQAKLSKNAEELYRRGNYRFQRKLYGKGQEEVGNTTVEYNGVTSKPMSKEEAKVIQNEVQKGNIEAAKQSFEKDVDIKILSKQLAKQTMVSATIGMGTGMLMSAGAKIIQGEEVKDEDIILDGLKAGGSVGVSTAIAGGLKTAVEKKIITGVAAKILKYNSVIGTIAFSAVSLVGVMASVGGGDMSLKDGMKETGTILAGTYGGIKGSMVGMALAGTIIGSVGVILTPVVAAVAGTIGYFVGSTFASNIAKGAMKVGLTIANGVKTVVKAGASVVKSMASGVKNVASKAWNTVKNIGSKITSFFGW